MTLDFYLYEIPFAKPFTTASGTFFTRKGLYLRLKKNDIIAWGEAAPLPGFSKKTLSDVKTQLKSRQSEFHELFKRSFSLASIQSYLDSTAMAPSLQFAVYTLSAAWLAQNKRQSLHDFLFGRAQTCIPINAVLGLENQNKLHYVDQFVQQGYKTIKIKADHQTDKLISSLENTHSKYPQLSIRIDANQSWSHEQAADCLQRLEHCAIEYCEEPLKNPDVGKLEKLSNTTAIPIALDESLAGTFSLREASKIVPVLILKPAMHGLPAFIDNILEFKKTSGNKIILTTALESGIGRLMTASLAGVFSYSDFAHGLGTGHLLKNDIWSDDRFICGGKFHLPDALQLAALMNRELTDLSIEKIS